MPSLGRRLVAEALGTFALVFIGAAVVVVNGGFPNAGIGLLGIALAHAVVLSVMITATMTISGGHLNPAVTIGLLAARRIDPVSAVAYIVVQLAAACCGRLSGQGASSGGGCPLHAARRSRHCQHGNPRPGHRHRGRPDVLPGVRRCSARPSHRMRRGLAGSASGWCCCSISWWVVPSPGGHESGPSVRTGSGGGRVAGTRGLLGGTDPRGARWRRCCGSTCCCPRTAATARAQTNGLIAGKTA